MPLSHEARAAVRAVTARHPRGAQLLLDRLRTAPEVTRRWRTRFGPLTLVLTGRPPLPPDEVRLCEAFALEWRRGWVDPADLADAVEAELARVTGRGQESGRLRPDLWRTLAGPQKDPGRLLGPN